MSVLHVQYERASDLQLQQLTTAVGARSVLCSGTVDHRRRTLHHHQLHCTDRDETRRLLLLRCRSSTASSQSPGDLCRRRSPLLQLTTRMWPRFGLGAFILGRPDASSPRSRHDRAHHWLTTARLLCRSLGPRKKLCTLLLTGTARRQDGPKKRGHRLMTIIL